MRLPCTAQMIGVFPRPVKATGISSRILRAATSVPSAKSLTHKGLDWRRRPDLNRGWRFCRPLPYLLATAPLERLRGEASGAESVLPIEARASERRLERETGFEP